MIYKWVRVPVIKELTLRNFFEHPPIDPYRYGEYPRDIVPPGAHAEPETEWQQVAHTSRDGQ